MDQFKCPTGKDGITVAKLMNNRHSTLTDWGLKKAEIKPNFVVLDIGCGGGETLKKLAQKMPQGRVYGIDHSKDMVNFSKQLNKESVVKDQVFVVEASVEKMKFSDNFFDLTTGIETYYFWPNLLEAFSTSLSILACNFSRYSSINWSARYLFLESLLSIKGSLNAST